MTVPDIHWVMLSEPQLTENQNLSDPSSEAPLVVVGPSLGTSVSNLWGPVARELKGQARILGWDLPGHGHSPAAAQEFTMAELAQGVLAGLDAVLAAGETTKTERSFVYAGCSVGGCVGQQLLVDVPRRVLGAVLVTTAQKVGEAQGWRERAELVAQAGTPTQVIGSAKRWFAEGFIARDAQSGTGISTSLLHDLQDADRHGYAQVCEALAQFDLRGQLGGVGVPVTVVAGGQDVATPPEQLRQLADAMTGAEYVEYHDVAHLPPAEAPQRVAAQIAAVLDRVSQSGQEA
ncbi:alpha/beta fold hydrolase [Kocuria sp.]|uniref:alpha/beta fold hydrolase n=1 Tax=Kocuria sp. TaxID=1871328 RepID=UPI0026E085EC|nr:alpha/beta fold hydrolase [Kocuria sp.]MDO5617403.1 alpha/beta fold hydrolase [Kocuria sp.]